MPPPKIQFDGYEGLIIMGPETAQYVMPYLIGVICLHRWRNEAADNFLMFVKSWLRGDSRRDLVPRLGRSQRAALLAELTATDREFYYPSGSDLAGNVAEAFAEIPPAQRPRSPEHRRPTRCPPSPGRRAHDGRCPFFLAEILTGAPPAASAATGRRGAVSPPSGPGGSARPTRGSPAGAPGAAPRRPHGFPEASSGRPARYAPL